MRGGIKPCYIHEELFFYRIRPDSMHQSLLKNQVSGWPARSALCRKEPSIHPSISLSLFLSLSQ